MAQINIGEGLWGTIRGYLNTMFSEIYASLGSSPGDSIKYSKLATLSAGSVTRVTTTLTTKPYSIMILDTSGNVITSTLGGPINGIQVSLVGGVYVLDIYSVDAIDVEILIIY